MSTSDAVAVALAALGAVLFGLASLRQQRAVVATVDGPGTGVGQLRAFWGLVRQRAWLIGAAQGAVAGLAHVVALALAPISLVQPLGVLAVPVTVVASAWATHRRPSRGQLLGASLSLAGIAVLTVLLLPTSSAMVLPGPGELALVVLVAAGLTALAALTGVPGLRRSSGGALLRCVVLATGAAVLFGLVSLLVRVVGHVLSIGQATAQAPLLVVSALGMAVALPIGLWAMQSAYLSGAAPVVLCCLTLVDPLTAVGGGQLLLHDSAALSGPLLVAAAACAVVAGWGVVLLAREYPVAPQAEPAGRGTVATR